MGERERLTGLDASYLYGERPHAPLHIGSVGVFDGDALVDADGRFRLDEARAHVESRLGLVPRFRKRVVEVPLRQGRPVWVDDPDFDVARHVRLVALPRPGDEAQLLELVAELQSRPLDRAHPLWELWFVEGLDGGRVALVQKIHHALADGVSGVDLATAVLDLGPDLAPEVPAPWTPEPQPAPWDLVADAWRDHLRAPQSAARGLLEAARRPLDTVRGLVDVVGTLAGTFGHEPVAPRSSLNRPVGPRRSFHVVRASLDDARAVKGALGGTVNDVVLTGVAGGVRRLLEKRGESVDDLVLRVLVPVSTRSGSEHLDLGNRTAAMLAPLPVGEPDPRRRHDEVQGAMHALKEQHQADASTFVLDLAQHAPITMLAVLSEAVINHQPLINLVVTNVPGPQQPLYLMGARMLEAFPVVPLGGNLTVGVAILSYAGALNLGIHADADACPDGDALAAGIDESLAELRELARTSG